MCASLHHRPEQLLRCNAAGPRLTALLGGGWLLRQLQRLLRYGRANLPLAARHGDGRHRDLDAVLGQRPLDPVVGGAADRELAAGPAWQVLDAERNGIVKLRKDERSGSWVVTGFAKKK